MCPLSFQQSRCFVYLVKSYNGLKNLIVIKFEEKKKSFFQDNDICSVWKHCRLFFFQLFVQFLKTMQKFYIFFWLCFCTFSFDLFFRGNLNFVFIFTVMLFPSKIDFGFNRTSHKFLNIEWSFRSCTIDTNQACKSATTQN